MKSIIVSTFIAALTLVSSTAFAGRDQSQLMQQEKKVRQLKEERAQQEREMQAQPKSETELTQAKRDAIRRLTR